MSNPIDDQNRINQGFEPVYLPKGLIQRIHRMVKGIGPADSIAAALYEYATESEEEPTAYYGHCSICGKEEENPMVFVREGEHIILCEEHAKILWRVLMSTQKLQGEQLLPKPKRFVAADLVSLEKSWDMDAVDRLREDVQ